MLVFLAFEVDCENDDLQSVACELAYVVMNLTTAKAEECNGGDGFLTSPPYVVIRSFPGPLLSFPPSSVVIPRSESDEESASS